MQPRRTPKDVFRSSGSHPFQGVHMPFIDKSPFEVLVVAAFNCPLQLVIGFFGVECLLVLIVFACHLTG